MITKIIEGVNNEQYKELFKKANEILNLPENNQINSLETYFQHIADLQRVGGDIYLKLPLDEEYFEIDANSRVITIPQNFRKNGIAVKGDNIAEILFFKIDRFFDHTDLNTLKIGIQWENASGDKGFDNYFIRDIESEEGKLIFGWPISSNVTSASGPVKFSVRFYGEREVAGTNGVKEITYNLSTLTANANVNTSLDFDLSAVRKEDYTDDIISRLKNSDEGGYVEAAIPIISVNLFGEFNVGEQLKIQAYTIDTGDISCEWKFIDENNATHSIGFLNENDQTPMLVSQEEIFNESQNYYEKASDGTLVKKVYNSSEEWVQDVQQGKVWTKYYVYEIKSPVINETPAVGTYYANIVNKIGNSEASSFSNQINVSGPKNINVELAQVKEIDFSARLIQLEPINFEIDSFAVENYQWKKNEDIAGANSLIYNIEIPADATIEDKENLEGFYSIKIDRMRNGKLINKESNLCELKFIPASLYRNTILIDVSDNNKLLEQTEKIIGHTIKVKIEENYTDFTDSTTHYKWYKNGSLIDNNTDTYIPEEACSITVETWKERKGIKGKSDSISVMVIE